MKKRMFQSAILFMLFSFVFTNCGNTSSEQSETVNYEYVYDGDELIYSDVIETVPWLEDSTEIGVH